MQFVIGRLLALVIGILAALTANAQPTAMPIEFFQSFFNNTFSASDSTGACRATSVTYPWGGGVKFTPNGPGLCGPSGSNATMDVYCTGTFTTTYPNGNEEISPYTQNSLSGYCPRGSLQIFTGRQDANPNLFSSCSCACPSGSTYSPTLNICEQQAAEPILSLTGPGEPRPSGTGGISTVELTAKVMQGGNQTLGTAVSFSVDVTPNSGGHEHHDVNRPKGNISKIQGTTDGNGEIKLTFTAPEIAGIHRVQATCATCANSPATKEIQVKVPDLLPISPDPPRNADGSYVYALTSVDRIHEGNARYHRGQYWLTASALNNLQELIQSFSRQGWGTVALNDASMFWGGRYDITGNWGAPHQGHRDGREIDISFTRANNPISTNKQQQFYKKFCEDKAVEAPFSILHHFVRMPHFHVYLDKKKTCNRTEN